MILDPAGKPVIAAGSGGRDPRVELIDPDGWQSRPVLTLREGESAYSVALSPDEDTLAAGTKAGIIYLAAAEPDAEDETSPTRLIQGAPVTSVCFAGPSLLASADSAGRCFLWNLTESDRKPTPLDTGGKTVCALAAWDRDVMGLTLGGDILAWQPGTEEVTTRARGPEPPPMGGLVRLVPWPEAGVMAYPAEDGDVCLLRPGQGDLDQFSCHDGEFYGIARAGGRLITAGYRDELLKFWGPGMEPRGTLPTGGKMVAVEVTPMQPEEQIVLVDKQGVLRVCSAGEGKLRTERRFGPGGYRTVVCLRPTISKEEAQEEARSITDKIRQKVTDGDKERLEELHGRLCKLGFETISLELRAEQARRNEETPAELKARKRQAQLLPDESGAVNSLATYAHLCQRVWQLEEARRQQGRINAIDPSACDEKRQRAVRRCLEAMEEGRWLAGPTEVQLQVLIRCASVMGKRFTGRWIINTLERQNQENRDLQPEEIVRIYEEIRRESGRERLPKARCKEVSWLTEWEVSEVEAVTCRKTSDTAGGQLEFSYLIIRQPPDTVVVPAVVFRAGPGIEEAAPEKHNETVAEAHAEITGHPLSDSWLDRVRKALNFALRRLVTLQKSPWVSGRE